MWALRSGLILFLCLLTWEGSSGRSGLRTPEEKYVKDKDNEAQLGTRSSNFVYRRVSSSDTGLDIFWVERADSTRTKRSTLHTVRGTWYYDIPYVIDASFKTEHIPMLKKAINYIASHVCVTFHDETNNFNESDPTWFTSHGYEGDAYIRIVVTHGCSAPNGRGTKPGPRKANTCYGFKPNVHEMLHTLGAIHSQNFPDRDKYMTVNKANIKPSLASNYNKIHPAITTYTYLDPKSDMMYRDRTWSSNGFETYFPIRDDIFDTPASFSTDNILFLELNQVYKCAEKFCKDDARDCGPGYLALESGVCRCVCPVDLDPATNCATQINGPSKYISWPTTPISLLAAGDSCPKGFDEGWVPLPGNAAAVQQPSPYPLPQRGDITYLHICSKKSPSDPAQQDWMSWPSGGHYSIIKPKGVPCGGPFQEGSIEFHTSQTSHPNGSVGDVQIQGNNVTVKFCTGRNGPVDFPVLLPSGEPFALISDHCPLVVGMIGVRSEFTLRLAGTKVTGTKPSNHISTHTFKSYQCSYVPPQYGCNYAVRLDKSNPSLTFTTPGWGGDREPSRRCFYRFEGPKDSKLRVTFHTYDVHPLDMFLYMSYNTWQEPAAIYNTRAPAQLLSYGDFLLLEWWSWYEQSHKKGVNFTVDVIHPEDFCYDMQRNGSDYIGHKSVSEVYEECVLWAKAVTCNDFPFRSAFELFDSGNQCRNPRGEFLQPWCYTYVNGSICQKRYCDVCNFLAPDDVIQDCAKVIAADPDFCKTAMEKTGCFKSCQLDTQDYKKVTCGPLPVPYDGKPLNYDPKKTYVEGDQVPIVCKNASSTPVFSSCTVNGWTKVNRACSPCPYQWLSHGDRCFRIFTAKVKHPEALRRCKSYGDSGTLFQIRNKAEHKLLIHYRNLIGGDFEDSAWISGQLINKRWVFTDTNISLPYENFTHTYAMYYSRWDCVRLRHEYSWNPNTHAYRNEPCNGNFTADYICQIDSVAEQCDDLRGNCEAILSSFPYFCQEIQTLGHSHQLCERTCGGCKGTPQCQDPKSSTYTRISANESINAGEVMIFACNPGLYHVSGNLTRACASSGQLVGPEPVCQSTPVAQDIQLARVRKRRDSLYWGYAILLDHEDYRIPFDGNVTKWYYYCGRFGHLDFFVYRKVGDTYQFVGSNSVDCAPGFKRTYSVPQNQRIAVKKGDVFGAYSPDRALSVIMCVHYPDKVLVAPYMKSSTFAGVKGASHPFTKTTCVVPSLAIRVEP